MMATEDNTQVVIDNLDTQLDLAGIASPGGAGTFSKTITLDKGETYLLSAEAENVVANREGLIGVLIESDKPIVVNSGSANGSFHNGGSRDYGIDQIVGADKIGKEFIFVKGSGADGWENILVVGHEDGTEINIYGSSNSTQTINAGEYHLFEGDLCSSDDNMYISTN